MAQVFGELPEPPQEEEAAYHPLVGMSTREGRPQCPTSFCSRAQRYGRRSRGYLALAFGILVGELGQLTLLCSVICEH